MLVSARKILCSTDCTVEQEQEFFRSIRLPSGVFKTTAPCRLDDVNAFVREYWETIGFRPSRLLDVGASSCISSVEWADDLISAGLDIQLVATDILVDVNWVELDPDHYVLTDADGNIMQHELRGRALRPWIRRRDYVNFHWLLIAAANRRAKRRLGGARDFASQSLSFVCQAAREHERVTVVEQDILKAPGHLRASFDVVRAANILNRAYFSDALLAVAVRNLVACLRGPGAFLLVARTWDDGANNATLFRLSERGSFEVVSRLGDGSEVEQIVLSSGREDL